LHVWISNEIGEITACLWIFEYVLHCICFLFFFYIYLYSEIES
jgi:hypothetical protein